MPFQISFVAACEVLLSRAVRYSRRETSSHQIDQVLVKFQAELQVKLMGRILGRPESAVDEPAVARVVDFLSFSHSVEFTRHSTLILNFK